MANLTQAHSGGAFQNDNENKSKRIKNKSKPEGQNV